MKLFSSKKQDALEERMASLQAEIEELMLVPEKLRKEAEEKRATLPPPEDLKKRKEQIAYEQQIIAGGSESTQYELIRGFILTVLLVIAAIAMLLWCYRSLDQYGIL